MVTQTISRSTAQARYSLGAILLHWLIAAALIFEIGLGWRMDLPRSDQTFPVYQLHKSIGITILLLTLLRIGWRITHRPPPLSAHLKTWEKGLAHAAHAGLYVIMLGLPLTGWLMVSTSKIVVPTILYGVVPWPHMPGTKGVGLGLKETLNAIGDVGHHGLIYAAYGLLALHIAGALKHHFVDRGDDFARIMPARRPVLTVLLAIVGAIGAGALVLGNTIRLGSGRAVAAAAPPPATVPAPAAALPATSATAAAEPVADNASADNATAAVEDTPAGPVKWTVEKSASALGFAASWSGSPVVGRFTTWKADILFDPEALTGSNVTVSIDMTSATTDNADTQSALPGDDWFAAAAHPTATFAARDFRKIGGNRYEARGSLTLRGVTKPLTLPFTLDITGKKARMSGTAKLDRTAFGIGQGQWTSTDEVSGTVSVTVKLSATRP